MSSLLSLIKLTRRSHLASQHARIKQNQPHKDGVGEEEELDFLVFT